MYLKALEIQGFKSFPERTRLDFERYVTAIVGPNGSGKSNISDAIRWVMGEQSTRTLRGGKMEDVIFDGTEIRRPVGFAEVTLILDNSRRTFAVDGDELCLTRRYFRSGESEYVINRETVRLKDIHEILMDTGMGRDGYAIIDKGRIGEILGQRGSERRDLFEEAAGIARFRHRKEESERKLQRTEDNLLRINDKIAELSIQVEPLREQSEVARRYLLLRDELRVSEVSLWLMQLDKLKESAATLAADFEMAKTQLAESNASLEQMYEESENFSENFRQKDEEAERIRNSISETEAAIADCERVIAVLATNLQAEAETIVRLNSELDEESGRHDTLQSQIDSRRTRIEELDTQRAQLSAETDSLLAEVAENTRVQGDEAGALESLLQEETAAGAKIAEAREKLSATTSSLQALYDRDETCRRELSETGAQLTATKTEHDECKVALDKAESERETMANQLEGYTLKLGGRENKAAAFRTDISNLTIAYETAQNRIRLLADMEKEYQGFHRAVREVMQESERGRLQGIHGPVANLVATEERYALAIEIALGGAGQNIIVDTPENGKYAIQFLKRTGAGRATFLPLSSVRGNKLIELRLRNRQGFVGIALDLVQYDPQFAGVYTNLLGRTVIVDNLDNAIAIAKIYSNKFRLVTLDGQVINAGGSMTGGSAGKTSGFLSRANELRTLETQMQTLSSDLESKKRELTELERELADSRAKLEADNAALRQIEDKALTLRGTLESHSQRVAAARDTTGALENEIAALKAKTDSGTAEVTALKTEITACQAVLAELQVKADAITQGQAALQKTRETLNVTLAELQAKSASIDAERRAALASVAELETLAGSLTGDQAEKRRQVEGLTANRAQIEEDITARQAKINEHRAQIEEFAAEIEKIKQQKFELEARRSSADKVMQEKNQDLLKMERECARLEQKKQAADMEEKQILDRLWDTYELAHFAALQLRQEFESLAAAGRETARLKQEIESLGTPNIGAIEQYEIIGGRYSYFTEQRDDILKAKSELESIIRDITGEMREIFGREFAAIGNAFSETFTELFGGGRAMLELEDPEDVLGSGIEIRAQPPGKTLRSLSPLSDGEKAFVAIALYFAVQKIRPTPFCIMDEIDAALDEANVLRFARYMRTLSDKTQFITITHKRGTMEAADSLFGVTMQEKGVSKVIQVDLEEAERVGADNR